MDEALQKEILFHQNNITRNIYASSGNFKALVPFVKIIIAKENTLSGTELKFVSVVWTKIGVACTPKYFEIDIVRFLMKQFFQGSNITNYFIRKTIDKISGGNKGFIPIFEWH